jgi:hypothetical protein
MSFIFSKAVMAANSANAAQMTAQWKQLHNQRQAFNMQEDHIAAMFKTNSGSIPRDVWRDMDTQTSMLMRQPNLTLLTDLMPLAKSLNIGKIFAEYRIAGDAGNTKSSISGDTDILNDKTPYTYDGNIIPVHTVGWSRDFREVEGMRSEGFDGLIDDSANSTRNLQNKLADYIYNGDADVVFNGKQGFGVKNHPNTLPISLGGGGLNINFATSTDGVAIRKGLQSIRDSLRITNAVMGQVTFYVSRAILSNLEQAWNSANGSNVTVLEMVRKLEGVADVKEDASLTGNQVIALVLDSMYIRPLVGMATGTYAVPRTMFNSKFSFYAANAVGLEIRKDATGKSAVAYAS